jgi:hypothetical protein
MRLYTLLADDCFPSFARTTASASTFAPALCVGVGGRGPRDCGYSAGKVDGCGGCVGCGAFGWLFDEDDMATVEGKCSQVLSALGPTSVGGRGQRLQQSQRRQYHSSCRRKPQGEAKGRKGKGEGRESGRDCMCSSCEHLFLLSACALRVCSECERRARSSCPLCLLLCCHAPQSLCPAPTNEAPTPNETRIIRTRDTMQICGRQRRH